MSDNIQRPSGPDPTMRSRDPNTGPQTDSRDQASGPSGASEGATGGATGGAIDSLRREGGEIASGAKRQISEFAAEQKEMGAEQIDNVARAVDRAAEELEQSSPQLARIARGAAEGTHKFSETLRDYDMRGVFREVNDFARREPVVFFSGALLVGVALSRFLRSSEDEHQMHGTGSVDPHRSGRPQ